MYMYTNSCLVFFCKLEFHSWYLVYGINNVIVNVLIIYSLVNVRAVPRDEFRNSRKGREDTQFEHAVFTSVAVLPECMSKIGIAIIKQRL